MGALVICLPTAKMVTYKWFWPIFFLQLLLLLSHLIASLLCQDWYHRNQIILDELGDDCLIGLGKYHHLPWWKVTVTQDAASIATVHGTHEGSEEVCCLYNACTRTILEHSYEWPTPKRSPFENFH